MLEKSSSGLLAVSAGLVVLGCAAACSKPDTMSATLPAIPSVTAATSALAAHGISPLSSELAAAQALATAAPASSASAGSAAQEAPGSKGDFLWQAPASFVVLPSPNTMRKATYKVTRAAGDQEDGDLSVTQVGGDMESNITRWVGQFEGSPKPKRSELSVGKLKVTVVELNGTFTGSGMGPGGGKKERFTMLVAIAPTEPAHFFKLVGPEKTIGLARRDFDQLVRSFRQP
jgi:hypothetical protein